MAIIRDVSNADNVHTYLATVALFCGLSCTILMLKLRGFKASMNLSSGKLSGKNCELAPQVSVSGAYRRSRDEYVGNNNYSDSRKQITPSMVKLPANTRVPDCLKPSKSTADLTKENNAAVKSTRSTPNVAGVNVSNATQSMKETKIQSKEQKKLEKMRIAEEKKREKLAAQERVKQEKLTKHREKQAAQQQATLAKEREKEGNKTAVAPQIRLKPTAPQKVASPPIPEIVIQKQKNVTGQKQSRAPPPPQFKTTGQPSQANTKPTSQNPVRYSTNTLESSISRSSGPPPYADVTDFVPNESDRTGNTGFGRPIETPSGWDMITQHRQQMNRTSAAAGNTSQQRRIDLQYSVGNISSESRDNSEA